MAVASHKISHVKKRAFLAAYGKMGNVALAAEIAKVDRRTHYDWLKNDPAYAEAFREFAAAFLDEQLRQLLAGFFVSQLHGLSFKEPSIVQKCDNLLRIRRIPWE